MKGSLSLFFWDSFRGVLLSGNIFKKRNPFWQDIKKVDLKENIVLNFLYSKRVMSNAVKVAKRRCIKQRKQQLYV